MRPEYYGNTAVDLMLACSYATMITMPTIISMKF